MYSTQYSVQYSIHTVLTCFVGPRHDWTILFEGRVNHTPSTLHHQVAPRNHAVWAYRYTHLSSLQQDITTPHTASANIQLIQKHFGMRVSSRNTEHRWPANFLDISPPNSLLWGHLKGISHKRSLQNPNSVEVNGSCCTSRIRPHVQKKKWRSSGGEQTWVSLKRSPCRICPAAEKWEWYSSNACWINSHEWHYRLVSVNSPLQRLVCANCKTNVSVFFVNIPVDSRVQSVWDSDILRLWARVRSRRINLIIRHRVVLIICCDHNCQTFLLWTEKSSVIR